MKIRNFLVIIFLLALIPFFAVTVVSFQQSINFQREQILKKNLETAETLSVAVNSFIIGIVKTEQTLNEALSLEKSQINQLALDKTGELSPELSSLSIYSSDGNVILSNGKPVSFPQNARKKIINPDDFAVSNLEKSNGKYYFHITTGIFKNGKLIGYIDGLVNDKQILDLVKIKIGDRGNTGVIDKSGRAVTLTFAPNATWKQRDRSFIPSIKGALDGKPSMVNRFFDPLGNIYRMGASVPINEDIGWVANVFQPEEEVLAPVRQRALTQALQSLAGSIISLIIILILANIFIEPIRELSKGTEAYRRGDFSHRVFTGFKIRELNELSQSFNIAAKEIQESFEAEKHIADELQRGLLPPEMPVIPGYDIGAFYASSTELAVVGGDFYDIFYFDPMTIGFAIGDVQGHGVEAALSTLTAKFLLRDIAIRGMDTGLSIKRINNAMERQLEPGEFITFFYGLINLKTGKISYSNAGHPPPLVYDKSSKKIRSLDYHNIALGIEPLIDYGVAEGFIEIGETLVTYTDGVIETRKDGDLFGEDRLREVIIENGGLDSAHLAKAIHQSCTDFAGGKTTDDIAILVIKRKA